MTAKKRKVVEYDGQLLLQRIHDDVVITLLKHEIEDTPLPDHDKVRKKPVAKKVCMTLMVLIGYTSDVWSLSVTGCAWIGWIRSARYDEA